MLAVILSLGSLASAEPPSPTPPARTALLSNVTFVVFDTETTGFSPTGDRIVEVGAVKFRNGKVVAEKSWLLNPQRSIPSWAQKVHGISDEMVKDKPTFKEFYPEFEEFIAGSVLMAHNARFDVSFVAREIKRSGLGAPSNPVIDTLSLFRKWFPGSASHTLGDVARYARVETKTLHRAEADSLYVYLIFDKNLKGKYGTTRLREIYSQAGGTLKF